ncbi:MAG: hypothetical protein HPY59_01235 [Anaerolineae bacterium]|nr:hypothetical protein [Anaerolineae bacterium]
MYGTIARLRAKPGALELLSKFEQRHPQGFVASYVYRMDSDPNELWLVVLFKDRESYLANAESETQHQEYLQIRALLEEDPQWHDGQVVFETSA